MIQFLGRWVKTPIDSRREYSIFSRDRCSTREKFDHILTPAKSRILFRRNRHIGEQIFCSEILVGRILTNYSWKDLKILSSQEENLSSQSFLLVSLFTRS